MEFEEQVQLPIHHFRKAAKREYTYWRRALIREFAQNSSDAGATEFHVNYENNLLTVKDNGRGMALEDCRSKLLTMGGTDKGEESIGGYGVAKQILFFAWPHWEIKSRDYKVTGSGCRYTVSPNEYTNGVSCSVKIDDDFQTSAILEYLGYCDAKMKTFVNGEEFTNWYEKGRKIRTMPWGILYKACTVDGNPVKSYYMNVRVRGVSMYMAYVGDVDCRLTIELTGNAREILTSNRDGMNEPYASQFSTLLREIAVNNKSSLREKDHVTTRFHEGRGTTVVLSGGEKGKSQVAQALAALKIDKLKEVAKSPRKSYIPEDQAMPTVPAGIQTELHLKGTISAETTSNSSFAQPTDEKNDITPTILLKFVGDRLPAKYDPRTWQVRTRKMMALWQRVVRQVLIDNKASCEFGIGMTLEDKDIRAEYITENGVPFFLLNIEQWHYGKEELAEDGTVARVIPPMSQNSDRWLLIQEMKQRALHEIAHFASSSDHNETFILTSLALEANTWKSEEVYRSLAKMNKVDFLR